MVLLTLWLTWAAASADTTKFDVQPFKINLGSEIPRLHALVNNTRLPSKALYGVGQDKGIELDFLAELRREWLEVFDWEAQEAELNRFTQYTAEIEGLTVHFVHEKSADPDAIPLILLHGWPGSFQEFAPIIKPLTTPTENVSFTVVVPSLPGFVFSSPPPRANWTVDDTARIFNVLMTEVLGYKTYALHGTDWGSVVGYSMYGSFNTTVRAAHFVFLPFFGPTPEEIAADNITLSDVEKVAENKGNLFVSLGLAYRDEQTQKPNDIGLALYDNPVGQLAWIGSKMKLWSDPRAGTPPSVLNTTAILTSVSLYALTSSFLTSVWIYASNPNGFSTTYSQAPTDAPMLFSQFEYNIIFYPEEYVKQTTKNLVSYKVHDFGGHFPGLDNPPALIEDIREIAAVFVR
ncbi:Alpha/Beta hydrolase protein [Roridomyces roridus]|uniref:Alpha/Beta hydrolase protein n=1 Tax=Roridomyces roridus TaxID=1738132 RepID=A0AAD7CE42_9AGAR|nr:Alpha/Beta hydrolase protein [Roridomyces roridus]